MRVVIVGGGQIGSSLARSLAADHEVVVIDHDRAVADTFTNIDAELIVGSGTSEKSSNGPVYGMHGFSSPPRRSTR